MFFSGIAQRLPRLWYRRQLALVLLPLLPFSWLFLLLVAVRRALYRLGAIRAHSLPVPVIVVGNLTVGGSGKTPLVLWLVERLREAGWHPGIISRGYGRAADGVHSVDADSVSTLVGDEPLLLARRSSVPIFVGRDRVAAGSALLKGHPKCDVIVSDDGLQHYRLQRSVEIAVFDGRGAGNAEVLPAGPLREPLQRISTLTAVVWNAAGNVPALHQQVPGGLPQYTMRLVGRRFVSLANAQLSCTEADLRGRRLHAMAGIGDPARFFAQLAAMGLEFDAHPFPDHHSYTVSDLAFAQDGVLLMTEKDAVKCAALITHEAWMLPVEAHLDAAIGGKTLLDSILEKIDGRPTA